MTVEEFYNGIGGNYEDVIYRLKNEKIVLKYLSKLLADGTFEELVGAMEKNDYETAFRSAHTLKGLCLNFSLTTAVSAFSVLTENLRAKRSEEEIVAAYENAVKIYKSILIQTEKLLIEQQD